LPPLEAWEKVFVGDEFLTSVHNVQNCIGCHGGVGDTYDMEKAHEGVMRDPIQDSDRFCAVCHVDAAEVVADSLHQDLNGYRTALGARGADFEDPGMLEAFDNHCATCHTTCGQCHISRPNFTDGGLIQGHKVKEIASSMDTCEACHGARVSNEYKGKNEGVEASVHYLEAGMACIDCHQVGDMHGDGTDYTHRYDGAVAPNCLDCHPEVAEGPGEIEQHDIHLGTVDCAVCHVSGSYKNCYDCHVGVDKNGVAYFKTDESQMMFKIGHNALQSAERPWEYVLVRHVPVVPDTFAFYGEDLLPTFDNVPTWKYATPHNIQRVTPQNQSCESCHDNPELFLMADDVEPEERQANAAVIVDQAPPSSWGPYTTTRQTGGIGAWSWLIWLVLAAGVLVVVAGGVIVLVNWQTIFSKGEQSV
jgi:nitrate/TMAO reductase-like tetraheme cytochrome c subunit